MKSSQTAAKSIDEYVASFPPDVRGLLEKVRLTIHKVAPRAAERICYRIPTFTLRGNLVHFAAYRKHIGFYPGATGIAKFKKELAAYRGAKGSVQFPLDQPVPFALIGKIVKYRVRENEEKGAAKAKLKRGARVSRSRRK